MPHEPEQWYKGCTEGLSLITKSYEGTFQNVFLDDFCARDRFEKLYIDITKTLHSDIPALLPNQEVPYADLLNKLPVLLHFDVTLFVLFD